MSYQVYDENGYIGDFATTKGFDDFMKWCESTEDDEIVSFAQNAMSIYPMALDEALDDFAPPLGDLKKTYDNFRELLPKCESIVMVSDGLNDDLEDEEELE
jgi:serine/threonine protein phosphatase PrpC